MTPSHSFNETLFLPVKVLQIETKSCKDISTNLRIFRLNFQKILSYNIINGSRSKTLSLTHYACPKLYTDDIQTDYDKWWLKFSITSIQKYPSLVLNSQHQIWQTDELYANRANIDWKRWAYLPLWSFNLRFAPVIGGLKTTTILK